MASIVLELQHIAGDGKTPITDVLRKALMVATKLKIQDFKEWVENEMGGYRRQDVPPYRKIRGDPRAFNPYRGWIPISMPNEQLAEALAVQQVHESISEVEHFAASTEMIRVKYNADIQTALNQNEDMPMECACIVQQSHFIGIANKVRDVVLQWALKLEEQGIMGDGMTFSDAERQHAKSPSIHIQNFTGEFRQYSNSTDNSTNTLNIGSSFDALRTASEDIANPQTKADALAKIADLQKSKDKPTALAKIGLVAGLASNGINVANAIAVHFPAIMAWINSLPK